MITQRMGLALLIFCAVTAASAQERILNFDHDRVDAAPQGWMSDGEPWRVAEETQASSPPHVLTPPRSVLSGGALAHLLVSSAAFLNGDVGVRFRITREDPPLVFGLIWSYADAGNYEEIEINTQSNVVALIGVRDGKPREWANDSLVFTPNTWHLLQIQTQPKQITLFLDNEIILTKKTPLRKKPGQIGLSVVPNSMIQFDDFAWRGN